MDEVFFIEHYCLADGKHIILKDYQKSFIKWIKKIKKKDFVEELYDKDYVDDFNMIHESTVLL